MTEVPVKVASTTGMWTAAGVWSGVIIAVLTLIGVWVKFGWKWRELGIGERRDDLDDMRKRIGDLERKVDEATSAAHSAELKLIYAVSAVQLLMGRLQAEAPDDPALKQARELLAAATTGGMPGFAGAFVEGLHRVKGLGE